MKKVSLKVRVQILEMCLKAVRKKTKKNLPQQIIIERIKKFCDKAEIE